MVPIVIILVGIVIDVKESQNLNVAVPIEVILVGIVTDVSDEHSWKAYEPSNSNRVSINKAIYDDDCSDDSSANR